MRQLVRGNEVDAQPMIGEHDILKSRQFAFDFILVD